VQRMRELGLQAGNTTLETADRDKISVELDQLTKEIGKIGSDTKFNNTAVFTANTVTIQAGANSETRTFSVGALATTVTSDVADATKAAAVVTAATTDLATINSSRAKLGAVQNRLEYTSSNLTTSTENLSAAES
ncbi:flagellin, partial [Clostridium tertium]